jgi:outer membrane protein TolC
VRETLQLTNEAFRAREVTLVEILTAQRQSLDSQQNYLEARIRRSKAKLLLDTVAGQVLAESTKPPVTPVVPKKGKR